MKILKSSPMVGSSPRQSIPKTAQWNRVTYKLKSKPKMVFGGDFNSIVVANGIVKISTGRKIKEFKYEEFSDCITLWLARTIETN